VNLTWGWCRILVHVIPIGAVVEVGSFCEMGFKASALSAREEPLCSNLIGFMEG